MLKIIMIIIFIIILILTIVTLVERKVLGTVLKVKAWSLPGFIGSISSKKIDYEILEKTKRTSCEGPFNHFQLCLDIINIKNAAIPWDEFFNYLFIIICIFFLLLNAFIYLSEFKFFVQYILSSYWFKLFSKSLIMGSLAVIIIKLTFNTTLLERSIILIFVTLFAMLFDIRERIKPIFSYSIHCLISPTFYHVSVLDLPKDKIYDIFLESFQDRYNPQEYILVNLLLKIYFSVITFSKNIFTKTYFFLIMLRLIIDTYLIEYKILYYLVFFYIIYSDYLLYLSYLGLFLILSNLLVYINESSLKEIKEEIFKLNLNDKILSKTLKINYLNTYIILFWNLKNLVSIKTTRGLILLHIINFLHYHRITYESNLDALPLCFKHSNSFFPILIAPSFIEFKNVYSVDRNLFHSFFYPYFDNLPGHKIYANSVEQKDGTLKIYFTSRTSDRGALLQGSEMLAYKEGTETSAVTPIGYIKVKDFAEGEYWLDNIFKSKRKNYTQSDNKSIISEAKFSDKWYVQLNFDVSSLAKPEFQLAEYFRELQLACYFDLKSQPKVCNDNYFVNKCFKGKNFLKDLEAKRKETETNLIKFNEDYQSPLFISPRTHLFQQQSAYTKLAEVLSGNSKIHDLPDVSSYVDVLSHHKTTSFLVSED